MAILCKWPILFCGLYLSTCLSSLSFIVFYIYFVCWCISLCGWHHTFSFLLSFFSFINRDLCMLSLSVVSDSLDPMGWRPPGIYVHGILQASILEWVAISSSVWQICQDLPQCSSFHRATQSSRAHTHPSIWKPPPPIFPSIRVFSNESAVPIRWPKYWRFSFSTGPSNEYSSECRSRDRKREIHRDRK